MVLSGEAGWGQKEFYAAILGEGEGTTPCPSTGKFEIRMSKS